MKRIQPMPGRAGIPALWCRGLVARLFGTRAQNGASTYIPTFAYMHMRIYAHTHTRKSGKADPGTPQGDPKVGPKLGQKLGRISTIIIELMVVIW